MPGDSLQPTLAVERVGRVVGTPVYRPPLVWSLQQTSSLGSAKGAQLSCAPQRDEDVLRISATGDKTASYDPNSGFLLALRSKERNFIALPERE